MDALLDDPRLALARSIVVEDPAIMGGLPVIRGTRVPAHDLAASVASGISLECLQAEHYTWLTLEQIELGILYARAFPLPARPPAKLPKPPCARLIASHGVPVQHGRRGGSAIPD